MRRVPAWARRSRPAGRRRRARCRSRNGTVHWSCWSPPGRAEREHRPVVVEDQAGAERGARPLARREVRAAPSSSQNICARVPQREPELRDRRASSAATRPTGSPTPGCPSGRRRRDGRCRRGLSPTAETVGSPDAGARLRRRTRTATRRQPRRATAGRARAQVARLPRRRRAARALPRRPGEGGSSSGTSAAVAVPGLPVGERELRPPRRPVCTSSARSGPHRERTSSASSIASCCSSIGPCPQAPVLRTVWPANRSVGGSLLGGAPGREVGGAEQAGVRARPGSPAPRSPRSASIASATKPS